MTRLPTPLHRTYRRQSRAFGPKSLPGLEIWYPVTEGFYQDAALATPAGVGDPVGARADASGNGRHAVQATTAKKPTVDSAGPGVRFDGVDDLLTVTYELAPTLRWQVMMAVWAKDGSDRFKLTDMGAYKANLAGEFMVEVEVGDTVSRAAPANFTPNETSISIFARPDFASTDGQRYRLIMFRKDANNHFYIEKTTTNELRAAWVAGGVAGNRTIPGASWSAGAFVFVGVKISGGAVEVAFDTDSDGTLNTATVALGGSFAASAYTFYVGNDDTGTFPWVGGVNLAVGNVGSSAPYTDRFSAGAGQSIKTWLGSYSESLVLYGPDSTDGVSWSLVTFDGAQQKATNTQFDSWLAQGRYDFDGVNDYINFGNYTGLDGATKFTAAIWFEPDQVTSEAELLRRFGGSNGQFVIRQQAGQIRVFLAASLADAGSNYATTTDWAGVAGVPVKVTVVYDGTGATNADRLKIYKSTFDPALGTWSADVQSTVTYTGTIPAALTTPTAESLYAGSHAGSTLFFNGKIDQIALVVGYAHTLTDAQAWPIYRANQGFHLFYTFDGNANNTGDTVGFNGTVTGAVQVADYRNLTGWARYTSELERQTSLVNSGVGIRFRNPSSSGFASGIRQTGNNNLTSGRWSYLRVWGRATNFVLRLSDGVSLTEVSDSSNTWKRISAAHRNVGDDMQLSLFSNTVGVGVYADAAVVYELATLAPTTATKAVPSRVIWSASKAGAVKPFIYAAISEGEKLEVGFINDAGTRAEASSVAAVSIGVHSVSLGFDGADLVGYLDAVEVCRVTLTGALTGLDTVTLGGLSAAAAGPTHPFDERIGEHVLLAGGTFLAAADRKRLHNWIAGRTAALAEVAP